MEIGVELVIYAVIFISVLLLVNAVYLLIFGKSISLNSRVNRRLEMMEKGGGREEVMEKLRKEMSQHMSSRSIPLYSILADKAQKANIAFTPSQLIMVMAALSGFAFICLSIGTSTSLPVSIALALGMGFGAVFIWVSNLAKKRMAMIDEQLPDAVELMVRSLKVGHPFASTLTIVSEEVPDPLGTEMGIIADENAYGRDVSEALKAMAERLDNQDLRFLSVAVTIQQQAGGNLAEILAGLSTVIRARFKLFRRVNAITAEAKWSGAFLSGFPVVALIGINILDPHYYDNVLDHHLFIPACLLVAGMLSVNIFVMKKLVDIKV